MDSINNFINYKNKRKVLFTPGPSSLSKENIIGLGPFFGRGDNDYLSLEKKVLNKLKKISGQNRVVPLQGSGSLAIEIMCYNFLKGKILIIQTGVYSKRIEGICKNLKKIGRISSIETISWKKMSSIKGKYNWIICCPTETSIGLYIPILEIKKISKKIKAKIMLDATASFGLEKDHKLADVLSFSSCKGLFGLTGGSFISFSARPNYYKNSFYLNLKNHENKKMTGPYHILGSLVNVLDNYSSFKKSVVENKKVFMKKFEKFIVHPKKNQPLICTYISKKVRSKNKKVVLYKSRGNIKGSVVSHLGETHLKSNANGKIINFLK